jgi:hypothetical protein
MMSAASRVTRSMIKDAARPLSAAAKARLAAQRPTGSAFPQLHLRPDASSTSPLEMLPDGLDAKLFSASSIQTLSKVCEPGDVVEIRDRKRLAAYAVWTGVTSGELALPFDFLHADAFEPLTVDDAYWRSKLHCAFDLRKAVLPAAATTAFRSVNGLGDGFPKGLTMDTFGTTRFVWADGEHAVRLAHLLATFELPRSGAAIFVGLPDACGVTMVSPQWEGHCIEEGLSFGVRIDAPYLQFDLRHRSLRQHLRNFAADRTVLLAGDTMGAFGANALAGLARSIVLLEHRGDDFEQAARDSVTRTTQPQLHKRFEVLKGTLDGFVPLQDPPETSRVDIVVVVQCRAVADPLRSLKAAGSLRSAGDQTEAGLVPQECQWPKDEQDWALQLSAVERVLHATGGLCFVATCEGVDALKIVERFAATKGSTRRQWRLLKLITATVDFPSLGSLGAALHHGAVFDVGPWR